MEIKIKLAHGSFIFIDDFSIKRSDGEVSVNLDGKTDQFIRTIATSTACGVLQSVTEPKDIVPLINSRELREATARALGLSVDIKVADVVEAPAEIVEVEIVEQEEVEAAEQEEVDTVLAEELPEDAIIDADDALKKLLLGNNKVVTKKIAKANLDAEERLKLVELETNGRNRTTVITAIQGA